MLRGKPSSEKKRHDFGVSLVKQRKNPTNETLLTIAHIEKKQKKSSWSSSLMTFSNEWDILYSTSDMSELSLLIKFIDRLNVNLFLFIDTLSIFVHYPKSRLISKCLCQLFLIKLREKDLNISWSIL